MRQEPLAGNGMPDVRERPLKVLVLATFFPRPGTELMGIWAREQATALVRQGANVRVVSPTPWVPPGLERLGEGEEGADQSALGRLGRLASTPNEYQWGELPVEYPRWLWNPRSSKDPVARRWPRPALVVGWETVRASLEEVVGRFRPDIIYAHHTAISGFLALQLYLRTGTPYVMADHDHGEITACERFPARRRLFEEVIEHASAMVVTGEPMETKLRGLFPHARTRVVHNGASSPPAEALGTPRPRDLEGRTVVCSVGHFYPRKGMPMLVRAFGQVVDKHPEAVLRIVGDGEDYAAVARAVADTGASDRITLLGMQPHAVAQQEMVWADVFALIGWNEPGAIAFGEAMAAFNPVITSDDGGINDVLADGVHGFAIPPRDVDAAAAALDRLLSDAELRERMAAAGRALFEEHLTWDENATKLLDVFRAAAGRSPVARSQRART